MLFKKGDVVNAVFRKDNIEIDIKAELVENANVGEIVALKVRPSGKVVKALIKGSHDVEILSDI